MPTFTVEPVAAAKAFLGGSQHEVSTASGLSFEIDFLKADRGTVTATNAGVSHHKMG
jgi:hypothetical protein